MIKFLRFSINCDYKEDKMAEQQLKFTYKNKKYDEPLDKAKLFEIGCGSVKELDERNVQVIIDIFNKIVLPMVGNPPGGISITACAHETVEAFGFESIVLIPAGICLNETLNRSGIRTGRPSEFLV